MDISELVEVGTREVRPSDLEFTRKTRAWCRLPYPGHPGGCPNQGSAGCPPRAPYREDLPGEYGHFCLVYGVFDFAEYRRRMLKLEWVETERQARCVLYWQGSLKRRVRERAEAICRRTPGRKYVLGCGSGFSSPYLRELQGRVPSMEAAGVYVFGTLENAGLERGDDFEVKPDRRVILVSLVCSDERPRLVERRQRELGAWLE
jgi:hypothetical protein